MSTVLFGISGSIAAFKALEVIRLLVADGVRVVPILSEGGKHFVTRATVEAITGNPAITEIFPENASQEIEHIALAQEADLLVTCPASADIIAKYATGIADDPLALVALAFGTPHLIAPAMNHRMWDHPATTANVKTLKERGCVFVGPDKGMMACGEEGWGRLSPVNLIYDHICAELGKNGPLAGKRVLVSAGATKEFLDDVRYLTNRSTGKMGYAIASAARDMGAEVVLVTASDIDAPSAMRVEKVSSALEMHEMIMKEAEFADAVVMTAAVADFMPSEKATGKIKKSGQPDTHTLELVKTPDILKKLGESKREGRVLVGFAAEYGDNGVEEATRKCREKSCDFLCLNDVSREDVGFASEHNELTVIHPDGKVEKIPRSSKLEQAKDIISLIAEILTERNVISEE